MKQEQVNFEEPRDSNNQSRVYNNLTEMDRNDMAPIQNSKSDYFRFMNFQRYYVFDSSQQESYDVRPLKIKEWQRFSNLVSFLHDEYRLKKLTLSDIKGIWPIISFFFPKRTGLFISQFYSMMVESKLDLKMYEKSQQKRQIQQLINESKQENWFKDSQFNQSLRTLIKQAKSTDNKEQTQILSQFVKIRQVLESNQQYKPFIQLLNCSLTGFNLFDPKRKQSVINTIEDWKQIVCNSIFEPYEQQYVLSEPDTLVVDICQTFEEEEYNKIRRKLSEKIQFDEDTQTHVYQSTAKKTPLKQIKNQHLKDQYHGLSKYKRKLEFSAQKNIFFSFDQNQQKTIPFKRRINVKPIPKNHLSKMIQNQRRINQNNQKRVKKNQKVKAGKRVKKTQNFFLQKQIKKIYFDESIAIRRQKRNVQSSRLPQERRNTKLSNRNQRQEGFENWNQRFVEDQSFAQKQSSIMEIQAEYEEQISSRKVVKKHSIEKRQSKQKKYNNDSAVSKEVIRRVSGTRRQSKQPSFIVADCYQQYQDEKNQQKMPRKRQTQQKSYQTLLPQRQSKQKNCSNQIKNGQNRPSFQKKGKQFTRLRKQAQIERQSQIQQNQSFYVNYDQLIDQSETINFQRKQNLEKNNNKKSQRLTGKKLNEKYLHLFNDNKKIIDKRNIQKTKPHTLDNYLISRSQQNQQKFEPLSGILVRKLSIFEFQQSQRALQRIMIIQNEQLNPYQIIRKQVCHYDEINQVYMNFNLMDYANYLESLQNEREIFTQIKQFAHEYLSKSIEPDLSEDQGEKSFKFSNQNNHLKLILISRKILAFFILIKKEKILYGNNDQSKKYSSFEQSYIKPLLSHYFYKILINMFAQIVNSLFAAEEDEDYSLLNKVSLPFMMLLYDIRQLVLQQSFKQMGDFCKSIFEDVYQMVNEQASLILLQIMFDQNKIENNVRNELKQKINKIMSNQNMHSYINLPRPTIKLLKKGLKVSLSQINVLYTCFTAYSLFQIGLYEKLTLIFTTTTSLNPYISKIKQLRQIKYEKGNYFQILQMIPKTIMSMNFEDKGVSQIRNLSFILNALLQKIDFNFDYLERYSQQCKVILVLIKSFRKCSQNTSQVSINSNLNKKKIEENQNKEDTLKIIKQIFNRCFTNLIKLQLQNSVSFKTIMNKIYCQQLRDLKLSSPLADEGEIFIQIELYFEIVSVFMKFKNFNEDIGLNKTYVINSIDKIFNQSRPFTFAGKNKLAELIKKIFDLNITGYRYHMFNKKDMWRFNDQLLREKTSLLLQKRVSITQEFWTGIKKLFQQVYIKCKEFSSLMKQHPDGRRYFTSVIDQKKYNTYKNLLNEMLGMIVQNINNEKVYNVEWIYQKCNQFNCLSYSLQHIMLNGLSFLTESNFFIDVEFINVENEKIIEFILLPNKLSKNLSKLTLVSKQIQIRRKYQNQLKYQQDDQDEDEQGQLFQLAMDKEDNIKLIIPKILQVYSINLSYDNLVNKNQKWDTKNVMKLGVISLVQLIKPILDVTKQIENNHNQKQRQNLKSHPYIHGQSQSVKPSLFIQFIKKFQYLSLSQQLFSSSSSSLSLNSTTLLNTNTKQLNEKQLQSLFTVLEYFSVVSKFIIEIHKVKQNNDKVILGQHILRRVSFEFNTSKVMAVNFIAGVVVKNMLISQYQQQAQISQKKHQHIIQGDRLHSVIELWCKLYEISNPSFSINNNHQGNIDMSFFLNMVFSQMKKSRQTNKYNKKSVNVFSSFLQKCHQLYRQRYHNKNTDQKVRTSFNNHFMTICEFMYSYMKQLTVHINRLNQKDSHHQNSNLLQHKHLMLQQISFNYMQLFNTVVKWSTMLPIMIQKLKVEFQTLVNTQIVQSINSINSINSLSSKSLLDSLIIVNLQSDDNINKNINHSNNNNNNKRSIHLVQECIRSTQLLQANVYKIKQTVPNTLFLLLLRKIIEQQVINNLNVMNKNKPISGGLNYLITNNNNKGDSNKRTLTPISMLKQTIQSLSQYQKDSSLITKVITSFIRFLDYKTQRSSSTSLILPTLNMNDRQKSDPSITKYLQQQIKLHQIGKKRVQDYRLRVFVTIMEVLKQSNRYREVLQKLLWQNVSHVQSFMVMRHKQLQLFNNNNNNNINNNNNNINNNNNRLAVNNSNLLMNKYLINTQQQLSQDNPLSYKYIQQIIYNCMIDRQSDFYLIKMIINSRIQKLINLNLQDNVPMIKQKMQLIQNIIIKAIQMSEQINNRLSLEYNQQTIKRCNKDLEQWFREKLQYIDVIKDILRTLYEQKQLFPLLKQQIQLKTLRDAYQCININNVQSNDNNNKQQPTQIEFFVQNTKMEVQQ